MSDILSLISISRILELPLLVSIPGLLVILMSLFAALISLLRLRLIRSFTNLVFAFVVAIILSQAGHVIAMSLGLEPDPLKPQSFRVKPASPSDFRYTA